MIDGPMESDVLCRVAELRSQPTIVIKRVAQKRDGLNVSLSKGMIESAD